MGNGSKLFYYRDQSGRAVGPLPLSEIERFVGAGVLSADIQVSKEGQDEWRALSSVTIPEKIPVATKVSAPSNSATARSSSSSGSGAETDWNEAAKEFKELGKVIGRDVGKGLWRCVGQPILYVVLLVILFKLLMWLLDRFMFPDGIF